MEIHRNPKPTRKKTKKNENLDQEDLDNKLEKKMRAKKKKMKTGEDTSREKCDLINYFEKKNEKKKLNKNTKKNVRFVQNSQRLARKVSLKFI